MILEALKSFGPKKPEKPGKGKKIGRNATRNIDTKSKETVKSKKISPVSARKTPVLQQRGKTPTRRQSIINEKRISIPQGGMSEGE
jgi:hypothetical protein